MRILKNNLCCVFRTHIGLSGGIQMTVLIHLPESIDEFLTELIEKKIENRLQPFFSLMRIGINFRSHHDKRLALRGRLVIRPV
jgi:hypothetical protein